MDEHFAPIHSGRFDIPAKNLIESEGKSVYGGGGGKGVGKLERKLEIRTREAWHVNILGFL